MKKKDSVLELTENEFTKLLEEEDNLVIVDFYAEWCMPCLMMAPVIGSLAEKYKKIKFRKINVDEARKLAEKYSISSIPCIIFFKKGEEVDRLIGTTSEEIIEEKIKEHSK